MSRHAETPAGRHPRRTFSHAVMLSPFVGTFVGDYIDEVLAERTCYPSAIEVWATWNGRVAAVAVASTKHSLYVELMRQS